MDTPAQLIGSSAFVRRIEQDLTYVARAEVKVLITGESGVGKEVIARLVHRMSSRAHVPLVTLNCAGVPDALLESELFGHVRGSFTDAYRDKRGRLEAANGGTIFLDEIGEMSLRMQALLLRFLETGEIQRIGSDQAHTRVDVRVIAATNRRLQEQIASRDFREDLYYRLNVVHVPVPPLRERREDVTPLLRHFLQTYSERHRMECPEPSPAATARLVAYDWPGNIRELKNVAERLVVSLCGRTIVPEDLPAEIHAGPREPAPAPIAAHPVTAPLAHVLYQRILRGESFWSVIYVPFMAHDITREDVRTVIGKGLEETRGSYKGLVRLFHVADDDYRRFLNFLRKYGCHMPFQNFRARPARLGAPAIVADSVAHEPPVKRRTLDARRIAGVRG